jgi:hypothetical protein
MSAVWPSADCLTMYWSTSAMGTASCETVTFRRKYRLDH